MLTPLTLTLLAASLPSAQGSLLPSDWPQLTGPLGDRTTTETIDHAALEGAERAWRIETPAGFSSVSYTHLTLPTKA